MPPSPALGDRALFPDLAPRFYLNHGGISPPSRPVLEAAQAVSDDFARHGAVAFVRCLTQAERVRALAARLLQVPAEHVALAPNTTRSVSDIALCFRWNPGDRVLLFEGEFPSNVLPWLQAARLHRIEPRLLSLAPFHRSHDEGLASLERELKAGARLVAVSAVQFQTGLRMPLQAMAQLCHRHGARLFVDAVQAVGLLPLALASWGVDYLAAGSHKWMMGLPGAGVVYASPEAAADLDPWTAGWLSTSDATRFLFEGEGHLRYDRPIVPGIRFLEGGNWSTSSVAALEVALSLIDALTTDSIFTHVSAYLDLLEGGLGERGFRSERSREEEGRSGILSVRPPGGRAVAEWAAALGERGVACATPDGRLRFTPHWPNALGEVPSVLDAVDEARGLLA
ncbi:MAG: aminotransferase class V-fold PLP-dependent enzyme [Polyangiaceae bacterium]|jgi:selenocysteine lyase/cysteine desulfurase|nr:aminotransferase class V-fold PLP-dependent enzyme [Polyangiaceae bacterium]